MTRLFAFDPREDFGQVQRHRDARIRRAPANQVARARWIFGQSVVGAYFAE
jgi:hypothetical protein